MPILALLLLLAVEAAEPVRGRVCIGDAKKPLTQCIDTTGRTFGVAAADRERVFVWTSADASMVQLGTIGPKAETIDLDAGERTVVELSIMPAEAKATVSQRDRAWMWTSGPRLRRLIVPRGRTTLALRAEHHRAFARSFDARDEKLTLGALTLVPLPQARGVVVDSEGKPIAGALVTLPDATPCATANEQGAFACELEEKKIEGLVVSSSGYGPQDVALPAEVKSDVDLGRITLAKGRTLTVRVTRPEAGEGTVTLFSDVEKRYDHSKLQTRDLREREEEVRFDVGEGKYLVLVSGSDTFERLEVPVTVKDADVTESITVEPFRLVGTVRFGDDLLREGRLGLTARENTWRGELPVQGGSFEATLWQRDRLAAYVTGPELGTVPEPLDAPAMGADPTRWDIRLEKKMIVGRVLDAETKQPVRRAKMQLTAQQGSGKMYSSVSIAADGSYKVISMRPGTYSLRVTSPEHVAASVDVAITGDDRIKTVDIALERGVVQPLEIVLASGAPAAGAVILEGVQPDRVNPQFIFNADADGRFALRGNPGDTRILYVVPREGSFAVVRTTLPESGEAKPLRVVVPDGTAALRVRTTHDDRPVAAPLLLRYNGEFVPGAILRFATKEFPGTREDGQAVLQRLPAGLYEVWALAGQADEVQLIAGNGALRPPARVGVSAGEASVQVIAPPMEVRRSGSQ